MRITSIFVGASVTLALGTVFLMLGIFIGSALVSKNEGAALLTTTDLVILILYAASATFMMFFAGGRVTSRTGASRPSRSSFAGFLTWALSVALITYPINTQLSGLVQVMTQEALAIFVTTGHMKLGFNTINEVKPSLSSDIELKSGKVETNVNTNDTDKPFTAQVLRHILNEGASLKKADDLQAQYAEVAREASKAMMALTFAAFMFFAIGASSAVFGASRGAKEDSDLEAAQPS